MEILRMCSPHIKNAALVSARGHRRVRIAHVRAHARDPGNETADALAKLGADGTQGDVLQLATTIHAREVDRAREADARDRTPSSAPSDAATSSSNVNSPFVAHSLGVG